MPFLDGRDYKPDALERKVLQYWRDHKTFQASIERRRKSAPFVFLEGPPTANGLPHAGHVLTRTLKDAVCRYQTMRGHLVERKAGWDCHGLPVEIEVEKELGLKNKQDIERYGVGPFNQKCRESVFRYKREWEEMSERVGFWLDFADPYVTLENRYIESVWWSLDAAWKKGLLYKGHRVTPHCPRCDTALSSHEVNLGYKTVEEPSVFVKFPVEGQPGTFLLAWTTTPWTLPGNVALAVGPDIEYVKVRPQAPDAPRETYILARGCLGILRGEHEVVESIPGIRLAGTRYDPLFPHLRDHLAADPKQAEKLPTAWRVYAADFVTTEDGTGIVHTAAMYGEDDYNLGVAKGFPLVHTVASDGTFREFVTPYRGQFVKDADANIIEDLRSAGLLYRVKNHEHEYPFCWRCSTPLLYYARDSWFIRMSQVRDALVAHNSEVNWVPAHVRDGRFGEFIGNVRDWALSRDRYWGTPLPVWTCTQCSHMECIGSLEELSKKGDAETQRRLQAPDLDLHKPAVDELHLVCPKCNGRMDREKSVIDTWYDSGAAQFAQWHYPFENADKVGRPVDFIAEGIDQTRGWFYTLLAESAFLFDRPSYRNVVVMGLVLDEKGQKMSKSKKNYTDPNLIFQEYGADAMRWYLLGSSSVTADKRFFAAAIRDTFTRFFLTLWNTYQFHRGYAELDHWTPTAARLDRKTRPPLDRWLLERLDRAASTARTEADAYNYHKAVQAIEAFLVDDVSNWWLRRSRRRFWTEDASEDKASAYATLYEALRGVVTLAAPYAPFVTEALWQDLRAPTDVESVHFLNYPGEAGTDQETELEREMRQLRGLTEAARSLRSKAGIKTRIPLRTLTVVSAAPPSATFQALQGILQEEANVKEVQFARSAAGLEDFEARIQQSVVGRAFKNEAKAILAAAREADPRQLGRALTRDGFVELVGHRLAAENFQVTSVAAPGTLKADIGHQTLFLDATLTPELEAEGWAREVTRRIQEMRKEARLELTETIVTAVQADPAILGHLERWKDHIQSETRSAELRLGGASNGGTHKDWDIEGEKVTISLARVRA
jgi:isoleucyl-tRNA synthetase